MFTPIELDQLPDADRYFIYGASVTGMTMHGLLAAQGHFVGGYFDTYKTGEVNFVPCRPPTDILSVMGSRDVLIIASVHYMEIDRTLRELGVRHYINGTFLGGPVAHKETATIRRFVNRFVPPGGITIDVGANVGDTAILFARRSRHVYAFEPNPELFDRFASVTECYGNITLVPYAASDQAVTLPLALSDNDLSATASSLHRQTARSIDIECIRLDDWCVERDIAPNFVKIDAEGHDVAVIEGARHIIERQRPILLMEASGTPEECALFEDLADIYRIVRVPWVTDPLWTDQYEDALAFYRRHSSDTIINVGFLPIIK